MNKVMNIQYKYNHNIISTSGHIYTLFLDIGPH